MLPFEYLVQQFEKYLPLDGTEQEALRNRIVERRIKRRTCILHQGDVCKHYTFVAEGCLKMYGADAAGKEYNLLFAAEGDWLADIDSLHSERPAQLFIETIEPSVVLQIAKADLWDLFTHYPKFDRNFRVIVEEQYIELQYRLFQTFSTTALERYELFLARHPKLIQRLPNTQIASYLGITPEFLSKIKSEKR